MAIREVGAVGVRVKPLTNDFDKELRRELRQVERRYERDPVDIAAELAGDLGADARREARAASGERVKFDVGIDEARLRRELRRVRTAAQEWANRNAVAINAHVDEKGLRKSVEGLNERFAALDDQMTVGVDVTLRHDEAFKRLQDAFGRSVERQRWAVPLEVEVDPESLQSIQRAIDQVNRRVRENETVVISTGHDHDSTRAALDELTRMKEQWESEQSLDLRFDASDLRSVERAIADLERHAERRVIELNVGLDDTSIAAAMATLQVAKEALERSAKIKLSYRPDDAGSLRSALAQVRNRLGSEEIEVGVDRTSLMRASAQIRGMLLRHKFHEIIVSTSQSAGGRAFDSFKRLSGGSQFESIARDVADITKKWDDVAFAVGKVGLVVGSIGLAATSLVGSLAAIGGDVLSISGLLGLAPGFLAAGVLSAVTFGAAIKDIGARLGDLEPKFAHLQDVISDSFWAGLEQPIRGLIDRHFPALEVGFEKVATAMGGTLGGFVESLNQSLVGKLPAMFDALALSIENSHGGMVALGKSVGTLGTVAAKYMPQFGQWITDILVSFDTWLTAVESDGRLYQWIDTAIANLGYLASAIGSVASMFNSLFTAANAGGFTGLEGLAGGLASAAEVMRSPDFHNGLARVFEGAREGMTLFMDGVREMFDGLGVLVEPLAQSFTHIGGALGTLAEAFGVIFANPDFGKGLVDLFAGIERGINGVMPLMEHMGTTLGLIGSGVGAFLGAFGTELGRFSEVGLVFNDVLEVVGPLAETLIQDLGGALRSVLPPVLEFVRNILPALDSGMRGIGKLLAPIGETLGKMLDSVLAPIGELIDAAMPVLVDLLELVIVPLLPFLEDVAATLGIMLQALAFVSDLLGPLVSWLADLLTPVLTFLVDSLMAPLVEAWNGLGEAMSFISEVAAPAMGAFFDGLGIWFQGAIDELGSFIGSFGESWRSFWDGAVGYFRDAFTNLAEFFGGIFAEIGRIASDIGAMLGGVFESVGQWGGDLLATAGDWVMSAFESIGKFFVDLKDGIIGFFANAGQWLIDAGWNIIQGFLEGLVGAFEHVMDFIVGVGDWIVENKGPEDYDKRLLIPAGRWIMEGFEKGLQSGWRGVDSTVSGMAGQIEKRFDGLAAAGSGVGAGAGVTVSQTIHAQPGMSEQTVADLAVSSIEYELSGVS